MEAIDLALDPDRLSRRPLIDEHDIYKGNYLANPKTEAAEGEPPVEAPKITIEVTITDLSAEQQARFGGSAEWLDTTTASSTTRRIRPVLMPRTSKLRCG